MVAESQGMAQMVGSLDDKYHLQEAMPHVDAFDGEENSAHDGLG